MNALLAVEDYQSQADISTVLKMCLPEMGLLNAGSGSECLKILRAQIVDLIILDYYLRDTSEPGLVKEIRKLTQTPIIVLSFLKDDADMFKAIENGADEFCIKPIKPLEFAARVRALLRRSGLQANHTPAHN